MTPIKLPINAYMLATRPGNSMGPQDSPKSAGTFGCCLGLRFLKTGQLANNQWGLWGLLAITFCYLASQFNPKPTTGRFRRGKHDFAMDMPRPLGNDERTQ